MAEKAVRTTTAKKPVRKAAPKKAASKSVATKKPTTKKVVRKTAVRKAPTPVATQKAETKSSNQIRIAGIVVFLLILGGSIAVGVSGDGQISIEGAISDQREVATPEQQTVIDSISVQETKLPDGGLVPSGVPVEVPKPEPVASSTESIASSTESFATSTDAVSDEVVDETIAPEEQDEEGDTTVPDEEVPEEEVTE